MRSKRIPDTPTQQYLRNLDACERGRRATGRKTLSEMFNTTRSSAFLAWYVGKAISGRYGHHSADYLAVYADEHFKSPQKFTPDEMREWAKTLDLTIPLGV